MVLCGVPQGSILGPMQILNQSLKLVCESQPSDLFGIKQFQ